MFSFYLNSVTISLCNSLSKSASAVKMKRKRLNRIIHKVMDKLNDDKELISELYFNHASVSKLSKKYVTNRSTVRYRRDKAFERLKEMVDKEMK